MSEKLSDSLLNAMDGVARYEAREELKRRNPAEVIPRLQRMLDEGAARFPHEIAALLAEISNKRPDQAALDRAETTTAPPVRKEPSLQESIEGWARYLGDDHQPAYEQHARQRLIDIGAPAIPILVNRLYNDALRRQRFAILQVLGEMGSQGVPEAVEAIKTAATNDERSIAGPAQAVLKKMNL